MVAVMREYDGPSQGASFRVSQVESQAELRALVPEWRELVDDSAQPNPFFSPWFLLPALHWLRPDAQLVVVVVRSGSGKLIALYPLEHARGVGPLWLPVLRALRLPHMYLSDPLVRRGFEGDVADALLGWFQKHQGVFAIDLKPISIRTAFGQRISGFTVHRWQRGGVCEGFEPGTYEHATFNGRRRKELKRLVGKIGEQGIVYRDDAMPSGPLNDEAVDRFLDLEQSGWKGRAASALGSSHTEREFFREMARGAAAQRSLWLGGLYRGGTIPVAMHITFIAGSRAFSFKIAYDENFAELSPGTILELEKIKRGPKSVGYTVLDSCAEPDNWMANRVYRDRVELCRVLIPAGRPCSRPVVWLFLAARSFAGACRSAFRLRSSQPDRQGD